jgi:hypothetical protein
MKLRTHDGKGVEVLQVRCGVSAVVFNLVTEPGSTYFANDIVTDRNKE